MRLAVGGFLGVGWGLIGAVFGVRQGKRGEEREGREGREGRGRQGMGGDGRGWEGKTQVCSSNSPMKPVIFHRERKIWT